MRYLILIILLIPTIAQADELLAEAYLKQENEVVAYLLDKRDLRIAELEQEVEMFEGIEKKNITLQAWAEHRRIACIVALLAVVTGASGMKRKDLSPGRVERGE